MHKKSNDMMHKNTKKSLGNAVCLPHRWLITKMLKMLKMLDEDIEERKNPKESCTPCRYRYLQNRNRRNTSFPHARPPSRAFRTVRSRAAATCARSHSRHCCSAWSIEATYVFSEVCCNFWLIFGKLWEARSRLHRNQILQANSKYM